ncbi:hypothetical protein KR074_010232, partial [Drosophila pseudoananassae]
PKIISKDGNLIFESGANRNISFRLSGSSRLIVNEDLDVLELLQATGGAKKRSSTGAGKNEEWSASEDVDLRELADQLADFNRRAFGPNGLNTILRQQQNRSRGSLALMRRYQTRLRNAETKLERLKTQLEADNCASGPCSNGATCSNTYNGFRCQCRSGFEGPRCELDVNECFLYDGTDLGCQNGGICQNNVGSFSCTCLPGWHGLHCTQRKGDCSLASSWELCGHGTCVPSADDTGYRCLCEAGWKTNGLTPVCGEDVDECQESAAHTPCSTKCINLPGSFTCAPCPAGQTGNGVSCQDLDECKTNNGGCSQSPLVDCINTFGSYHCGDCPVGWTGDGRTCERSAPAPAPASGSTSDLSTISSCAQRRSQCHPAASCFEISGTAVCSCPAGMVGTGYGPSGCVNGTAKNCGATNPCLNNGICLDVGPSNFTCICGRGFRPPLCEPLASPCTANPCQNGGRCRATQDGFVCQCLPGYRDRLCSTRFSSCNSMLSASSGRLRYPPENAGYEHNAQCAWVIRTNESLVLNVTFHTFDVEDSTECRFDWLQVNDGRSAASQIIGRYCGNHLPHGGNIISSGNQLYLWFRSDNSTAAAGFDLTWTSMPPQCGGRVEFETHGTLASPGSPGNYPKNRDCQWHLVVANSKRIKLTFFSLQLEQHTDCNFDYVEVKDVISGRQLAKYCSSGEPAPLLLPTHEAQILFHSDADGTDTGFQLHYSAEERIPGCGGVYTAIEGTISGSSRVAGTDSDSGSGESVSCEYEIHLAVGELVSVKFQTLELGDQDCLEVWDANDEGGSILQEKICGPVVAASPDYTSQNNRLRIKFYASSGRFQLRYEASCSQVLDSAEGTITSPGFPDRTNWRDRMCTFTVKTSVDTVITVKLVDFDLYGGEMGDEDDSCLTTSLNINDGMNRQILGPFCGSNKPQTEFISNTNFLQFHLTTDSNTHGRGFKFTYEALPGATDHCGGVYTKPGQNIRLHVDEEGRYAPEIECLWVIAAPANKVIRLHWLSFSMEDGPDCNYDYVEVYDTLDVKHGHYLSTYCGRSVPEDLLSQSRHLVIKFVSDYGESEGGFELAYTFEDRPECGGQVHSSSGEITSPSYPANYSEGLHCEWHLTARIGSRMEIQVEVFDLEVSANCSADYLEVLNGGSPESMLIGRFCGKTIPTRLPGYTNEMRVIFHSDVARSGRGFRLRWRLLSPGCGGRLKANRGVITSPRYPNPYPHLANCEWGITVHPGSEIALLVEDIQLESWSGCYYDSLKIYEGRKSAGQHPKVKLCSELGDKNRLIRIQDQDATIAFNSDSSNAYRGFRISYEANCRVTLSKTYGTIESLNYMEPFEDTIPINCNWTIKAPRGNRIRLEISHLETHEEHIPNGQPGGLYILDGNGTQKLTSLASVNSTGDTLTLIHNSSNVNFQLDYRIDGCQQELRGESGTFQSPNHPGMYPNNLECYWLIDVGSADKIVEVTVHNLDLEETVNCTKDALTFSNHANEVQAHDRHCGSTPKLVVTSSGHRLHVRFISDGSHNGQGFVASYRAVHSECGGKVSSRNGVILSPNYPSPYPQNSHCEWQVEVSPHHRIVFDVQDLQLEPGMDCSWDYLEAYDLGEDEMEGQRLFHECYEESVANGPVMSASNLALVRFVSDDSISRAGFRLHFHESCGQQISIDESDFDYIQLSRQAPRNESCLWVIQAQEATKHIIVTPTHVKLRETADAQYPTEGDCMSEGVKIYEGTEATGTPRLTFCRSHPPAIISNGQALTISVPLMLVEEFDAHYMTMDNACGSLYTALSGKFTTPYYPSSYPANIECTWVLVASAGNSLSLTLESMDLEQSEGCNRDYLEVREEGSRGALIGVYCGQTVPPVIRSRGTIWMKFKSDDDNVGEGFMASYNYEHHNELNGTDGVVDSPHYPSNFKSSEPYSWRITVDKEYVVVISMQHLRDVDQAHLTFYDGYSDIGSQIPLVDVDEPIWSSTNVVYFTAKRGPFRLTWQRLSKQEVRSNRTLAEQSQKCGKQVINVGRAVLLFKSPGYPDGYEHSLECVWNLVPYNPAVHVTLTLDTVDLESFGDGCLADYLQISSSSDLQNWSEPKKICELPSDVPSRTIHGTPYLRLEFITDASVNRTGFKSLLRTACGSDIFVAGKMQLNVTEVLSRGTATQQDCIWTLRVRQGRRIRLEFPEVVLRNGDSPADSAACENFLVLRNGGAGDSPFLGRGKYCEDNIADALETSSNTAYVKFHHKRGPVSSRVTLSVEEVGQACSRRIQLTSAQDSEVISSPLYPNLPHPHSECVWVVTAPPEHRIMLHFEDRFDLEDLSKDSGECQREFVQVNDGGTELKPEVGRFCGNRKPDTIYSKASQMRIRYFTDVAEPHSGFKATVKLASCGGAFYSSEGVISSPSRELLHTHLEDGRPIRECVYTIEMEKGTTIDMETTSLNLPSPNENGNCSQNTHLLLEEIEPYGEEGEDRVSDKLYICGTDSRHLIVETNKVVIRFRIMDVLPPEPYVFSWAYKSVGSRCGETIHAVQGVLQTPGYPDGVTRPVHCIWKLEVPKGRRIKLEILDFSLMDVNHELAPPGRTFRGRLTVANDHRMISILGRYTDSAPAMVISSDNTMGVEAFLMPISRHRGFKLRFSAYGLTQCRRFDLGEGVKREISFQRTNITQALHCSYDLVPPVNSTLLIEIKAYNTSSAMMLNNRLCSLISPLKLKRQDQSESLLSRILCGFESLKPDQPRPTVRLPFPIQLSATANARNGLTNLVLGYSVQACGGMIVLEPGDSMVVRQPSGMAGTKGAIDCAWAIGPGVSPAGEDSETALQDIQLEVSVELNLPTPAPAAGSTPAPCQNHYLNVYSGPDQNSPSLGMLCNSAAVKNLVVERGLFLEYHAENFSPNATFNVSIKYGSGCGGKLQHPFRPIDFGEQYKNNMECVWEVETEPGYHIGLSFLGRFFIEDSSGCTKDYLLVQQRNESTANWTDIQRICGRVPPDQINTTMPYMRLTFRSDGDVVGDGFQARFERNCGGVLYAEEEEHELSSPGFPTGYDKNLHCSWTIVPRDPYANGVLVSFLHFDLENSPTGCMYDNVTVTTNDNDDDRSKQAIICGMKLKHEYRAKKSVNLVFATDNSYSGRGFQLLYTSRVCGGVISQTSIVESPKQHTDNSFPPSSDCYWNLTAPEGHKFTVKFEKLDFETQSECIYDGVEIFSGPAPVEAERRVRYCGRMTDNLPVISIPRERGLIHSFSDERDPSQGFRALVRVMRNCDEVIAINGSLYTYNRFNTAGGYANDLDCEVNFQVHRDQQIKLQFSSFHVQSSDDCQKDFVELRDGAGPFADLIGRFCGNDLPPTLVTTRHTLFLRFVTDATVNDSGFELQIDAVPRLCGSPDIKLDSTVPPIVSLGSPNVGSSDAISGLSCFWKISSDKPISLHFNQLSLQGPDANGSCANDYLRVYTREDAEMVRSGFSSELVINGNLDRRNYVDYATERVFCGNSTPDTYHSNSNEVYLKFHRTNRTDQHASFRVSAIVTSNCEWQYTGLQGRVHLSETSNCDVMIKAPENYTLSLYYTDLVFGAYDCEEENLQVFDRGNRSLQKVCGYIDSGKSLFTSTNELRLHVKTGTYLTSLDLTYLASPVEQGPGCGGQFYNTEGQFTNPFYPANIRNNSDCRWVIRVPSNNKVMLNFDVFNLGSRSTCHTDYLQILEQDAPNGEEKEVRRFCGDDNPRIYISKKSELVVRFHKTVNYDGVGWVIRFAGVYSNYRLPAYLMGAM